MRTGSWPLWFSFPEVKIVLNGRLIRAGGSGGVKVAIELCLGTNQNNRDGSPNQNHASQAANPCRQPAQLR